MLLALSTLSFSWPALRQMVRFRSGGGGVQDPDEATPIMHPVRMELAPHARLGRRMHAMTAILVLLVFHVAMLCVGILNWMTPCDGTGPSKLALYLIIYAGIGLVRGRRCVASRVVAGRRRRSRARHVRQCRTHLC